MGTELSAREAPMPKITQKITPFLWFDNQAEEAVNFYTSIFKNSKGGNATRYDDEGSNASGRPKGSVMTVPFQLEGQDFVALNGGPMFKFHRGGILRRQLRDPEGSRPLLGEAVRRRRGSPVRVAQGQIRPVLAGGSHGPD
jgi:3-demethylubiquinone-9 3-methyltransferase